MSKTTLKRIAKQIAGPGINEEGQYLNFILDEEIYAINILCVREIIEYQDVTDVPMLPDYVSGVVNLRGRVLPVVDLLKRFGRKSSPIGKRTCIVVIQVISDELDPIDIGIVVDSVSEVAEIPIRNIEKAPTMGSSIKSEFIAGLGKMEKSFVIILTLDSIITHEIMQELMS